MTTLSPLSLRQRLSEYEKLMRLDKPIGILLLLWPTLWALWVASDGRPAAWVVAIFVVGTVLMRSAGCVINDYADKDFDGHVERTRNRPLAARRISPKEALGLAAGLALLSFLLVLPLNGLTIAMSVPAVFLAGYPYTKRFLAIPQAYLGIAFGFGIPMAFAGLPERHPAGGVGDAARQRVLGGGLRHRVRDGGPAGRPEDRHQDLGDHLWPLRGCGDHDLLRRDPAAARLVPARHRRRRAPSWPGWRWRRA